MKKSESPIVDPTFPSIAIKRVDTYSFQLIEVRGGKTRVLQQDTFTIVKDRADMILQRMAEGLYA